MNSMVSEKGQVTIPKVIRERLGIRAGDELEFEEEAGRLVARKVSARRPIDDVYGILKDGPRRTDAILRELRGDPDAVNAR